MCIHIVYVNMHIYISFIYMYLCVSYLYLYLYTYIIILLISYPRRRKRWQIYARVLTGSECKCGHVQYQSNSSQSQWFWVYPMFHLWGECFLAWDHSEWSFPALTVANLLPMTIVAITHNTLWVNNVDHKSMYNYIYMAKYSISSIQGLK